MWRRLVIIFFLALLPAIQAESARPRNASTVKKEKREANRRIRKTKDRIQSNVAEMRRNISRFERLDAQIAISDRRIAALSGRVDSVRRHEKIVSDSVDMMQKRVEALKESYASSLRSIRRQRQLSSATAFIFSSRSFAEARKRMRYLRELGEWQTEKAADLKQSAAVLEQRKEQLDSLRKQLSADLASLKKEKSSLEADRLESDRLVKKLRSRGRDLEKALDEQQKQARKLDDELNRIIEEEARKAAEAERRRKRLEEEAAARRADSIRLENERRDALAKAEAERLAAEKLKKEAEERARIAAEKAAKAKTDAERAAQKEAEKKAREEAREAERARKAAEKEAKEAARKKRKPVKNKGQKPAENAGAAKTPGPVPEHAPEPLPSAAKPAAATFAAARGLLPMPVSGSAVIVSDFGRHTHKQLSKVEVQNNGIDIETTPGASAVAVYPGVVSMVIVMDGYHNVVLVRHGEYLTVYAGISSLSVRKGQQVSAGQPLGRIWSDPADGNRTRLHFEVRHEKDKLNPAEWLR